MNSVSGFWAGIALTAFCLGLAVGHFVVPRATEPRIASSPSAPRNLSPATAASVDRDIGVADKSGTEASRGVLEPNVYARIQEALASGGTTRLYEAFQRIAGLIDDKNVHDVLAFADKVSKKDQKDALISLVVARWAEFAAQLTNHSSREISLQAIGSAWGKQDPEAALAWANGLRSDQERNRAQQSIFSAWANKDPQEASGAVTSLPSGPVRDQVIAN